jgi:hypothetical protein
MDLFLLHCLLLLWTSLWSARHLAADTTRRMLSAGLLAWSNLIATSLVLSPFARLGSAAWFIGVSTAIGGLTCLATSRPGPVQPTTPAPAAPDHVAPWWQVGFVAVLGTLTVAGWWIAWVYPPNQPDALTYELPRSIYYLGQGSLAHFDAADPRQVLLPNNFNILQFLGLVNGAPLQVLNFLNFAAWVAAGLALHRLCRLAGAGAGAALAATGLALAAPLVLAQAFTSTAELPAAAALLAAAVFALHWSRSGDRRDAALGGLAAGIAAGSSPSILLFGPALALLLPGVRRKADKAGASRWAILLALAAGLPFALCDLADRDRWGQYIQFLLEQAPSAAGLKEASLALLAAFDPLSPTGLGLGGIVFLGAALAGRGRGRGSPDVAGLVRMLAAGWLLCYLLFRPGRGAPGAFVPFFLLLTPALALAMHSLAVRPGFPRRAGLGLTALLALATAGMSTHRLWHDSARPLAPLLRGASAAAPLPFVPLLPEFHLKQQLRVNIDTDGADEPILPFLLVRRDQRITSRHRLDPESYNLISRPAAARQAAYRNPGNTPASLLIAFPGKRSAGVEFLATVGRGDSARDYFGLAADAGRIAPVESSSSVLVTVYPSPAGLSDQSRARLRLAGLQRADQARLVAEVKRTDGSVVRVAELAESGDAEFALPEPFSLLTFRLIDDADGGERGSAAITYRPTGDTNVQSVDPSQPTNGRSLFVTDLVLSRTLGGIGCEGLLPVEGPFPQWNLPLFRWAVKPSVRVQLPSDSRLARLLVSFSAQPQVRHEAELEVYFNGKLVGHRSFTRRDDWQDMRLDLVPQAGANVLEFRDATYGTEPDWDDYLARYPDVRSYLLSQHLPLEAGAREHYETHGKAEGRTLRQRPSQERIHPPKDYYFIFRTIRLEGFRPE